MESLFTNSPVHETMEYIINEIYVVSKISKLCSKLIFKLLLLKLTTENTFMLNSKFFNSNHPNIKYTIERDPDKLLDTKYFRKMVLCQLKLTEKIENYQYIGLLKSQISAKEIQLQVI